MTRPVSRRPLAVFALGAALFVGACSSSAATPSPTTGGLPAATAEAPGGPVAALPAEVSTAEAKALQDGGAFVLDVRQPDEWAAGHIQGATLIPLGELATRLAEVPNDRQVVVVCRSGNRSAQGRDILLGAGYPSVTSMAGGMNGWTAAGYPTASGN